MHDGINVEGTSDHNLIGGGSGFGNVICGNDVAVGLRGPGDNIVDGGYNMVDHNILGTAVDGVLTYLDNSISHLIGNAIGVGTLLDAHDDQITQNMISGNFIAGVVLGGGGNFPQYGEFHGEVNGNTITNNGLAGVIAEIASQDCTISNNTIASNGIIGNTVIKNAPGVWIFDLLNRGVPTGISVLDNSIHDNTGLGIDLGGTAPPPPYTLNDLPDGYGPDRVTPNDPLDADSGPNGLQNYPLITSVTRTSSGTVVSVTLDSAPDTPYHIEFFANTGEGFLAPDGFRYGQGERYLGSVDVTTDDSGNALISTNLPPSCSSPTSSSLRPRPRIRSPAILRSFPGRSRLTRSP